MYVIYYVQGLMASVFYLCFLVAQQAKMVTFLWHVDLRFSILFILDKILKTKKIFV